MNCLYADSTMEMVIQALKTSCDLSASAHRVYMDLPVLLLCALALGAICVSRPSVHEREILYSAPEL